MEGTQKYQEQTDRNEELPQSTPVADMLEKMRKVFVERDEEYARMESAYQKRKETLDAKEVALQETLAVEKAAMQEAKAKFEKEKTEQWMKISLAREEARNEKLRCQRLVQEYEEKLSRLPGDGADFIFQQGKTEQDFQKIEQENARLQEENQRLTETNRELEEESRRLQEEKGELFRKLMGKESVTEKNGQKEHRLKEELVTEQDDLLVDKRETGSTDETWVKDSPLTAETLQAYWIETGTDARLLHSRDGELVAVTLEGMNIMFSFRETPWFDIRKKQKGGWGMKKLMKRYNENNAGLSFSYDEIEEELIGSGEFSLSMSPEELVHKVYQAARMYFGHQDEGKE
ncbi:hypothetical protein BN3660_01041 [Eubacteriaceae bacterium CHKCI004]|nr:hypothetical protein BN3660_01041 [Eubacteriaceae bacterium CHKCI004]